MEQNSDIPSQKKGCTFLDELRDPEDRNFDQQLHLYMGAVDAFREHYISLMVKSGATGVNALFLLREYETSLINMNHLLDMREMEEARKRLREMKENHDANRTV